MADAPPRQQVLPSVLDIVTSFIHMRVTPLRDALISTPSDSPEAVKIFFVKAQRVHSIPSKLNPLCS